MKNHIATLLLAFTFGTGCAHATASTVASGPTVSQVAVAGDVAEPASCGPAAMQTHFFHGSDGVAKRVIDRERCGVIELRVVDLLDTANDTRVREILHDRDHDGTFERRVVEHEKLEGSFAVLARSRAAQ